MATMTLPSLVDVDAVTLARDPSYTTTFARALDVAMANDASARARYAAIYGAEWFPLSADSLDLVPVVRPAGDRFAATGAI